MACDFNCGVCKDVSCKANPSYKPPIVSDRCDNEFNCHSCANTLCKAHPDNHKDDLYIPPTYDPLPGTDLEIKECPTGEQHICIVHEIHECDAPSAVFVKGEKGDPGPPGPKGDKGENGGIDQSVIDAIYKEIGMKVSTTEVSTVVDTVINSTVIDGKKMKQIISDTNKNANNALIQIEDATLDNKLTPQEKKSLHTEWQVIVADHPQVVAHALVYRVVSVAYENAYTAMNTLLTPLISTKEQRETTSDIVRDDFVSITTTLYREKQALLNAIDTKIKELGENYANQVGTEIESTVTREYLAAIEVSEGKVKTEISDIYTTKNDFGEFINGRFNETVNTIDGVKTTVGSVQTKVEEVNGELKSYQELVATYMQFTEAGLEIGKTNSKFRALLDNEKLAFMQDSNIVSYISNSKMYITKAEVTEQLTIGQPGKGYFDWIQRANGNLGLQWRRG